MEDVFVVAWKQDRRGFWSESIYANAALKFLGIFVLN